MAPILETRRLWLRPRTLADLENCLAMDCDPAVARRVWGAPPDWAEHRARLADSIRAGWPPIGAIWIVEEKAAPGFLGQCGLFPLEDSGFVEIGYRYVPKAWGRGIGSEAAARVLDHGFRALGLDPIVAVTRETNMASRRVLEKIGLQYEGVEHYYGQELAFFRLSRAGYLRAAETQTGADARGAPATRSGPPRIP